MIPAHLRTGAASSAAGDGAAALEAAQAHGSLNKACCDEVAASRSAQPNDGAWNASQVRVLRDQLAQQTAALAAPVAPRVLAPLPPVNWEAISAIEVLAGSALTPSACRTWAMLHDLALKVGRARGYAVRPDVLVYHLPAGLMAAALGIQRRQLQRDRAQLEALGVLASGGQAQKVNGMSLYGGCLWAVALTPPQEAVKIHADEWHHQYRDFEHDIREGRTVQALLAQMSQLHPEEAEEVCQTALREWVVSPQNIQSPVDVVGTSADLRQIAYTLGDLAHTQQQAELIGRTGAALARALGDLHSRRWYCALLWEAVRSRRVQVLQSMLVRLSLDLTEYPGLNNPGALLAWRISHPDNSPAQGPA